MYRRKTVEALLRHHARREEALLAIIRDQNDRIMLLAGKPYAPTPLDMHVLEEPVDVGGDEELTVELGQLPDDLGIDPY